VILYFTCFYATGMIMTFCLRAILVAMAGMSSLKRPDTSIRESLPGLLLAALIWPWTWFGPYVLKALGKAT
jgi:hypothetical protein